MKKAFLLILMFINLILSGAYIEIGSGTGTSEDMPCNGYFDYGWSESLYLYEDLFEEEPNSEYLTITSVSFYISENDGSFTMDNQKIYMFQTASNEFLSSAYTTPDQNNLVFAGTITWSGTGWNEIILDTPFDYQGDHIDHNFIIQYENHDGSHSSPAPVFMCSGMNNTGVYNRQDVEFPTYNGDICNVRPDIRLGFDADYDAGISDISVPAIPFSVQQQPIAAVLTNYGSMPLTSVDISWYVNGSFQSTIHWTGDLDQGAGTEVILTSSFNFPLNTITEIKAVTSNPNSATDEFHANDTFTKELCPALTGTLTVGSECNCETLADATCLLNLAGVGDGGVTFVADAGIYEEQLSFEEIPGSCEESPVVFCSANEEDPAVLQYAAEGYDDNWVVKLDGTDYVTFEDMEFAATSATGSYGNVFVFQNGASNNSLLNNTITSIVSTSSSANGIYFSSTGANSSNQIIGNDISNGYAGFYLNGNSTDYSAGNVISDNTITNFNQRGIYAYTLSDLTIDNNNISGGIGTSCYGIYLYYCDNGVQVTNNTVDVHGPSKNTCLYIYYCDGAADHVQLYANNMLSQSVGTSDAMGINIYKSSYCDLINNSINITAGSTTTGRGIYLYSSVAINYHDINVFNNAIVNTGGGLAIEAYTDVTTGTYLSGMDYNDYFSTGAVLGKWGTTSCADITEWETACPKDQNSISVNPLYSSDTDLHSNNSLLNGTCPLISDVLNDFDDELRNDPTDIGADEFSPVAAPNLFVAPASNDFSDISIGLTSSPRIFTVSNTGSGTVTVSSLSLTGSDTDQFELTDGASYPVDLNAGEFYTVSMIFTPDSYGVKTANLTIVTSDKTSNDFPITGNGYALIPPSLETFDIFPPYKWTKTAGLLADPSVLSGTYSNWTADGFANVGYTGSAKINITSTYTDEWLITPPVSLDAGTDYQLEFDAALTNSSGTGVPDPAIGEDDRFAVVISTDNGTTWTSADALQIWDNTTVPSLAEIPNTCQHITLDLSGYSGLVQFGFYAESSVVNSSTDLFIDNVQLRQIPFGAPQNVQIVQISDDPELSWDTAAGADSYNIYSSADPYASFPSGWTAEETGVTGTSWTDTDAAETRKFYIVTAVNSTK